MIKGLIFYCDIGGDNNTDYCRLILPEDTLLLDIFIEKRIYPEFYQLAYYCYQTTPVFHTNSHQKHSFLLTGKIK